MQNYEVGNLLGDGTFGSVTKAVSKITKETVAIKKMRKKYFKWDEVLKLQEIRTLVKLKHPNIVKIKEIIKVEY